MKRPRLATARDFEYAIKWEKIRIEYFRVQGFVELSQLSEKNLIELENRQNFLLRNRDHLSKLVPREDEFTQYYVV